MRKNGINRSLAEIEGGVCAPSGFKAGGIYAGFTQAAQKKDLALIIADRPCPTACVFSETSEQSGAATATKKHLKRGLMQAVLINSGVANICVEGGELLAEKACRVLASKINVDAQETVIASIGEVGKSIALETFEKGIPELLKTLSYTKEGSKAAAEASIAQEFAYSFKLGDIVCKMGGIYHGATLAFLTTDVCISPEMLQKALSSAVKDTFNLLCVNGIASPNDTVCIMANGKAGNYKISCADTEYRKFFDVLKDVLTELCRRIARGDSEGNCVFSCKVSGAKSKQIARALAKSVVQSFVIRQNLARGMLSAEQILYLAMETDKKLRSGEMSIHVGEFALFEAGRKLSFGEQAWESLRSEEEIEISIILNEGNYSAKAYGYIA